jgi:ubiquinone/menaquinone biosynthesis C-methylase UbiE
VKLEVDRNARRRFHSCLDEIARIDFASPPAEPTPAGYYPALIAPAGAESDQALDKHLRYYLDLFELAGRAPYRLRVLEVGSGFGLGLVAVAVLGAEEAHGVEIVDWQVEFARKARDTLPDDLRLRVKPVVGSATDLPYADATLDVLLSLESVSHYLDYQTFLDEAHRVLRPGGVLVISDANNGLNPLIRRRTRRLWASHEVDPSTEAVERPGWPWYFVTKREQIIAQTDPTLDREVVHDLALRTAGLIRPQIVEAVRSYRERGTLPESRYRFGTLTVHPEHEMVMERLFNPFALGRELTDRGFDVRVRGHWGGAGGSRVVRFVNSVLRSASRVTMPTARGFRIRAVKRGRSTVAGAHDS